MEALAVIEKVFEGHQVRVIMIDGEPWFVAKDVCDVLGLNPRDSVRYLDDDEKRYVTRGHLGLSPGKSMLLISEPGLYSLIFRSRKPEVKPFKRWLYHDLLPTIRKTGQYVHHPGGVDVLTQLETAVGQLTSAVSLAKHELLEKEQSREREQHALARAAQAEAATAQETAYRQTIQADMGRRETTLAKKIADLRAAHSLRAGKWPLGLFQGEILWHDNRALRYPHVGPLTIYKILEKRNVLYRDTGIWRITALWITNAWLVYDVELMTNRPEAHHYTGISYTGPGINALIDELEAEGYRRKNIIGDPPKRTPVLSVIK